MPFPLEPSDAQRFIDDSNFVWHQRFELAPGVETPGANPIAWLLERSCVPASLAGMTVLDIGTTNGAVAFECERRGADRVVAVDIFDDTLFGFGALRELLGSDVEFLRASVYELPDLLGERFDLVVFWGVLYHLRHPLLGLDAVRRLARNLVTLETAVCNATDGDPGPLARFHRLDDLGKDGTNWWSPSVSALHDWVMSAGFRVTGTTNTPDDDRAARSLMDLVVDGDTPEYLRVSYEKPVRVHSVDFS